MEETFWGIHSPYEYINTKKSFYESHWGLRFLLFRVAVDLETTIENANVHHPNDVS